MLASLGCLGVVWAYLTEVGWACHTAQGWACRTEEGWACRSRADVGWPSRTETGWTFFFSKLSAACFGGMGSPTQCLPEMESERLCPTSLHRTCPNTNPCQNKAKGKQASHNPSRSPDGVSFFTPHTAQWCAPRLILNSLIMLTCR